MGYNQRKATTIPLTRLNICAFLSRHSRNKRPFNKLCSSMSKKRKHDQVESDAGAGNSQNSSAGAPAQAVDSTQPPKSKGKSRQERSERRSKKQKRSKAEPSQTTNDLDDISTAQNEAGTVTTDERAKQQDTAAVEEEAIEHKPKKAQKTSEQKESKTPSRFIVFVGNLPFDATAAQVKQHFSKLAPTSVRMSTDKATGRGKGFAFLEFDVYDKMKTCLKLYHHSIFDPHHKDGAEAPDDKRKGRRINVELTAGGGGGKSKDRKAKIITKNKKLEEERERQRIKDKADKEKAARKSRGAPGTGANAESGEAPQDNRGVVHPSRLSRVQH